MPCTTILVGRHASHDGSTIVARNEDSLNGEFTPKRFCVVTPEHQPRVYHSVLSGFEIDLPQNPMRYTSLPNALPDEGIWAAAGINEANVGMSATETITTNERVLAADPLIPQQESTAGGIGEEDLVTLVLPYIHSAREGVLRLGELLQRYGTYEMNGIAFQDANEIWWLETIGGHHWMARRVPDDCYAVIPNQLSIDWFDFADAEGAGTEFLCSADLRDFVETNHLDLSLGAGPKDGLNPRLAFGSSTDADHVYNTPRAWSIQRQLNPHACSWDEPNADLGPESADIPWCRVPERKITLHDIKRLLSDHYQGTPYDPYGVPDTPDLRGRYRTIGINRTSQLSATQIRGGIDSEYRALHWIAFGSNPFNALVPLFANVDSAPDYFATTEAQVSTESFYWTNRLIGALADAYYGDSILHIERYQQGVVAKSLALLMDTQRRKASRETANAEVAQLVRTMTDDLLGKVLFEASLRMRNAYSRSDG